MSYHDISDVMYDVFMLHSSITTHKPTEPSIVGALAGSIRYDRESDQYSVKRLSFSQYFQEKKKTSFTFFYAFFCFKLLLLPPCGIGFTQTSSLRVATS